MIFSTCNTSSLIDQTLCHVVVLASMIFVTQVELDPQPVELYGINEAAVNNVLKVTFASQG